MFVFSVLFFEERSVELFPSWFFDYTSLLPRLYYSDIIIKLCNYSSILWLLLLFAVRKSCKTSTACENCVFEKFGPRRRKFELRDVLYEKKKSLGLSKPLVNFGIFSRRFLLTFELFINLENCSKELFLARMDTWSNFSKTHYTIPNNTPHFEQNKKLNPINKICDICFLKFKTVISILEQYFGGNFSE